MEPTSEQELKQLFDEGKVTEKEYKELTQAMAERTAEKKAGDDINIKANFQLEFKSHQLGKIALTLALSGIIIPITGFLLVDLLVGPDSRANLDPWIFLFYGMELPGFVIGAISWKTIFGRAATVTSAILLLLSINIFAFSVT